MFIALDVLFLKSRFDFYSIFYTCLKISSIPFILRVAEKSESFGRSLLTVLQLFGCRMLSKTPSKSCWDLVMTQDGYYSYTWILDECF